MEKYTEVKVIGQGAFGKAVLVKLKSTQEEFVVKKIHSTLFSPGLKELAVKEVDVLKQLHHENIVSYIESFEEKMCFHIVMSYCSGGNLATKIARRGHNLFPEPEILKIFCQLCQAVDYMHSKKILHRDIKPENIFLTSKDVIKLGDFGLSKVLDQTMQYARTMAGTLVYMSPEILNGSEYKNKSDMWSLGCVLYELTTLKRAFITIANVISGKFNPVSSDYSHDLQDLISELLSAKPDDRPSASDVLAMGFVKGGTGVTQKPQAPTMAPVSDLDLLLLGSRGNGRSATGNTILGIHRAFNESNDFKDEGCHVSEVKWCRRGNLTLKVIDGPCFVEGGSKLRNTAKAFVHCPRGFHALVYVLNFASPRLTEEDVLTIKAMIESLGKDVFKNHGIIVVTHGECFDLHTSHREWMTFETWCQKQDSALGEFMKECGNRVVLFHNLTPKKHQESVNKLISLAQGIGSFFTCEFLNNTTRQKSHKSADDDIVPENVLCRIDLCVNDLRRYIDSSKLTDYHNLKNSAANLLAEIDNYEQKLQLRQEDNPNLTKIRSLIGLLMGKDRVTVQKLHDTLFSLQAVQEPYKRISVKHAHKVSKCCIL